MMLNKMIKKISSIKRINTINKNYDCSISIKSYIDKQSTFEGRNNINAKTSIINSKVGFATYISSNCTFSKTKIGRYCSIGPNVKIVAGNHPTNKYVSTHPIFYTNRSFGGLSYKHDNKFEEYSYVDKDKEWLCTIGNDVWIGSDVKILNGVCIGEGAIIATGSVVTKDVKAYEVVGGVPARFIKYRFDKNDIDYLIKHNIWSRQTKWIEENARFFSSIESIKHVLDMETK